MILMMGTKDEDMPIQPVEKTKWVFVNIWFDNTNSPGKLSFEK